MDKPKAPSRPDAIPWDDDIKRSYTDSLKQLETLNRLWRQNLNFPSPTLDTSLSAHTRRSLDRYLRNHLVHSYRSDLPKWNALISDQRMLFGDQQEVRNDFRVAILRLLARERPDILLHLASE